ncbi:Arylsulfatase precursor [Posidoniimonas polymericola]|uniref:Arylsulfatase n=1 Tax=Posidoniimonas polymericola TaxID=2528002 RepID=A0A5C5ZEI4_9BACT|nr:arylsulfatase [Posidoniimonas polymericola]TWT85568.1 Arylsulfatase precursor [Posidoniimonas polymericola]
MRRQCLCAIVVLAIASAAPAAEFNRSSLPITQPPFKGKIGLTPAESTKDFPAQVAAPKGAPNVLVILTDDVGFGASSTFGGPIPTPTFERLARSGLRYNQFHTTALCSPTRAALITGRNHHRVSTGVIMEAGVGYPGYNTLVRKSCGTIGQILKYNGYNTSWFGKNHNVPDWQSSQAGPFDLWPTGLGFEYFYGFVGGDTNQWAPALTENTRPIEPPANDPDYNFDVDMANRAIAWMRMQNAVAPDKPFFCYYATGTAHAPHHAPKEWIDKFKGKFDQGWDQVRAETLARQKKLGVVPEGTRLTERSEGIAAWDSLNDKEKELYARMMEVYAAALAHADHQFGRIIDAIKESGELDNTLIIYIQGDNGASAEGSAQGLLNEMTFFNNIEVPFDTVYEQRAELGGPMAFNHYPIGWAHAMDSPFQWTKQVASHFGGTRNGMVISWPSKIKEAGRVCPQFHHVIDIAPTILEAAGLPAPESIDGVTQEPMDGVSLAYTFTEPKAESKRTTQYFEMFANRAIYDNGWVACTKPPIAPWVSVADPVDIVEGYEWELYNISEDFSESNNVASQHPDKLRGLQRLFYIEAVKNDVLPLDNSKVERLDVTNRPSLTRGRDEFTYYDGMTRIPEGSAPDMKNKSFGITAVVEVPEGGAEGLLMTQGGRFCGLGLYLLESKPVFVYNLADVERYRVESPQPLGPGEHVVTLDFRYDGGGVGKGGVATLSVDGSEVASKQLPRTIGYRMSLDETLDIGEDTGTPVSEDYQVPFKFTGEIDKVTIKISDHELTDEQLHEYRQQQVKAALSR